MIKKYKNQIFQYLLSHPLGVDNFELSDHANLFFPQLGHVNGTLITYKPYGDLRFAFADYVDSFDFYYAASANYKPNITLDLITNTPQHFLECLDFFKLWIQRDIILYRENQDDVDLWTSYQQRLEAHEITQIDYTDDTHFTPEERQGVKLALQQLKLLITDRYISEDIQKEIIGEQIKYLTEKVDDLSKTDWKGIFQNTLISIMITLTLDTQKGAELLALVIEVFKFAPGLLHLK